MPIFKIGRIGTREVSIEEAESAREACAKAGWKPEECDVQIIPEGNIIRECCGTPERGTSSFVA
ncbi:MAG TPA: hypothetical protein VLX11_16805 [Candidatus Acidoferrales bacterium]|nr:hypothetical protein [Candidatus Acidoferrales bacterium]